MRKGGPSRLLHDPESSKVQESVRKTNSPEIKYLSRKAFKTNTLRTKAASRSKKAT
jgi:hypothetical protein